MRCGRQIFSLLTAIVTAVLLLSAPIAAVEAAAESIQRAEIAAPHTTRESGDAGGFVGVPFCRI